MNLIHIPVMAREVIDHLVTESGRIYVDCTLGSGGHAARILEASSPCSRLIGIDIDPQAIALAKENLKAYEDRVSLVNGNFVDLRRILSQQGVSEVDGVLMDLGISSIQLDSPERGFSFKHAGPLDMRMNQTIGRPISCDINTATLAELIAIIREFGEERWAKRIASSIVKARERSPITTTTQLAEIIEKAIPKYSGDIHPATRTFQAFRIYKNQELVNLENGLVQAIQVLRTDGRICVISFHSLEDRIVKHTFRMMERGCICPPDIPKCICGRKPVLKILTKRPLTPREEEIEANPRARSAKLRVAVKV